MTFPVNLHLWGAYLIPIISCCCLSLLSNISYNYGMQKNFINSYVLLPYRIIFFTPLLFLSPPVLHKKMVVNRNISHQISMPPHLRVSPAQLPLLCYMNILFGLFGDLLEISKKQYICICSYILLHHRW